MKAEIKFGTGKKTLLPPNNLCTVPYIHIVLHNCWRTSEVRFQQNEATFTSQAHVTQIWFVLCSHVTHIWFFQSGVDTDIWSGPLLYVILKPLHMITGHVTGVTTVLFEFMSVFPIHPWLFLLTHHYVDKDLSPYSVGVVSWNLLQPYCCCTRLPRSPVNRARSILSPQIWFFIMLHAKAAQRLRCTFLGCSGGLLVNDTYCQALCYGDSLPTCRDSLVQRRQQILECPLSQKQAPIFIQNATSPKICYTLSQTETHFNENEGFCSLFCDALCVSAF